jgi:hypothetical protein
MMRGVATILLVELTLVGCWANPSAVKINSYPPGAKVSYQRQQLGLTPLQTVLACEYDTQFVHLELPGYPSYTVALRKRPITYYVPWFAVVAAGIFSFNTTWRSRACTPEEFTVEMATGEFLHPDIVNSNEQAQPENK